jgi:hypothetical protein
MASDEERVGWWSRKFIAYMLTVPLLIAFLLAQIYVNYQLALNDLVPIFTEEFMTLQLYIIGVLVIVYIGGQATLDAILGWVRGGGGKSQPQVIMMAGQAPAENNWGDQKGKLRPRNPSERMTATLDGEDLSTST